MPRKLYPSEARKIRILLGEGFSDLDISRALHVALSAVTNLRNGEQVDSNSESMDQGQLSSDNLEQESETDESLTEEEETDLQIYEMIHSGHTDSEIAQKMGISEDNVRNYRSDQKNVYEKDSEDIQEEPKQITFVGGRKHEEQEEEELKEKDSKQEEDVYMCDNCNYQQNTLFSKCPKCYYDMEWDENSKSEESEENEYQCYDCDYIEGSPFSECPKCRASNTFEE